MSTRGIVGTVGATVTTPKVNLYSNAASQKYRLGLNYTADNIFLISQESLVVALGGNALLRTGQIGSF